MSDISKTDLLGDRMKAFEGVESQRAAVRGKPLLARLDGRAFSTFTTGLRKPYDQRLIDLMVNTTKYLVEETNALLGYTQSDEISLAWYVPEGSLSEYMFNGKYQKIVSTLAALCTGYFIENLAAALPEKARKRPTFDARVWQVDTFEDMYDTFLWREKDAVKNSITLAALGKFSHKQLQGVNGQVKKEMLREIGAPWEEMPEQFRRGTYLRRETIFKELDAETLAKIPEGKRPTGPVQRSVVEIVKGLPNLTVSREQLPLLFRDLEVEA
jgi:tRNA(His) 5'-end guanylyltransferase